MTLIIAAYLAVIGLVFGSFINAASWRLRLDSKLSLFKGRSKCDDCGHELSWQDLIPLFSWIWLGGKCRYCKKPISAQNPIIELTTATLFVLSYLLWDTQSDWWQVTLGIWLFNMVWLITLAVIDLMTHTLPYKITFPLAGFNVLVVIVLAVLGYVDFMDRLIAVALFAGGFWLLWVISRGRWIGDGDVPLLAVMGLILGTLKTGLALFIGSTIGSLIAAVLIIAGLRSKDQVLPFGPLLVIGTIIAQLFGDRIIDYLYFY